MKQRCQLFAILTYHRILTTEQEALGHHHTSARISVTLKQFENDINLLCQAATVLPLTEALQLAAVRSLPDLPVVITFDDGFKEHFDVVLPMLEARDMPGTFFLCAQTVGHKSRLRWIDKLYALADLHSSATKLTVEGRQFNILEEKALKELKELLRQLSPQRQTSALRQMQQQLAVPDEALDEIADRLYFDRDNALEMAKHQCVTLGGHGSKHLSLANLSTEAARKDIDGSYFTAHVLSSDSFIPFAYPFGGPTSFSSETVAMVQTAGFSCACSSIPGLNASDNAFYLQRFDMCMFSVASTLRLLKNNGVDKVDQ